MKSKVILMKKNTLIHKNGVVYTPKELSDYLATKIINYVFKDSELLNKKEFSIVDPANGDGMLLEAIVNKINLTKKNAITVCGIDIDYYANESSRNRVNSLKNEDRFFLINTNSLTPYFQNTLHVGWKKIFDQVGLTNGFDIMIANPPWGADISDYKQHLDKPYYKLLSGQVDSYELFLEMAFTAVNPGGYFGFLIPDSILNQGKMKLRERILYNTEIKFIARLGEKLFPGINRACVILVCKNIPPTNSNIVDCFRLDKIDRKKILLNELSFEESESRKSHRVPQNRFLNNDHYLFDIDLRQNEVKVLTKMRDTSLKFKDILSITRGIELGSSGYVSKCPKCGTWSPLSSKEITKCNVCKNENIISKLEKDVIVSNEKTRNSVQLITGKDIKRYELASSLWIKNNYNGINYKSSHIYDPPKILIRKTGVGITASLDYSDAYTTQVVYLLKPKKGVSINLEYIIALLNSRAYFFYLIKSYGEIEWRSHPYLTQAQIKNFPIPDVNSVKSLKLVKKITNIIKNSLNEGKPLKSVDLEIELLIGRLYKFDNNDYERIFEAIEESEDLLPVKALKTISLQDIIQGIRE